MKISNLFLCLIILYLTSCTSKKVVDKTINVVQNVDPSHFITTGLAETIRIVPCKLSHGVTTDCYEIVTNAVATDHEMGPWCPSNISDDASKGGIWIEGGEVYDVDGAFIQNMANFYSDETWQMYDAKGNIYKTKTKKECAAAARPDVDPTYQNYCVECLPSYLSNITQSYKIPVTPVKLTTSTSFAMGHRGGSAPSARGLALNGVVFDAPAPTNAILDAYTLAPFDDAGGHINLNAGYHYHAAMGLSTKITQTDGHAAMIGYAMDGHGIYERLDTEGKESTDLDECRGHYDDVRGYHYHVAAAGTNSFIDCLHGAHAN